MNFEEARGTLEEMKKEMTAMRSRYDSLQGQKELYIKRLKEFGCDTLPDAEKKVASKRKELDRKEKALFNRVSELIKELEWDDGEDY